MSSGSQPPLTRTSTATGSEDSAPLVTPFDDFSVGTRGHHHHNSKATKVQGQAALARYESGGVHIRSPSDGFSSPIHRSRLRSLRSGDNYTASQGGAHPDSYFAIPLRQSDTPDQTEGRTSAPALSRRGTTKELIGRFELMDGRAGSSRNRQASLASRTRRTIDGAQNEDVTEKPKEKGRSPIRQSFRNLLSVFKKSKPAQTDQQQQETTPSLTLSVPGTRYSSGGRSSCTSPEAARANPLGRPSLTLQIPSAGLTPTDPRNCVSPISAHTGKQGPLLYLCRATQSGSDTAKTNENADLPPVWMPCLAQLHTTHVLVSWQTSQGNPTSRLVPFTACTDVRSLALGELDPGERSVLPAVERPDLRVFELLFEGRAREKFAVEGVTERAGWVSAIWDAVLLAQENRVRSPAVSEFGPAATALVSELQPQSADAERPTASRMSRLSTTSLNRALPAIPVPTSERPVLPRLDLRDLPPAPSFSRPTPTIASGLSPLPAPPTTPTSVKGGSSSFLSSTRCDSPSGSRLQSPSIRNLDQRSVVKQRLAQIADSASAASARSSSPISPSTRRWELRDSPRMHRQGSTASSGTASILNSYARTDMDSPRSSGSGRLTTQPPSPIGSPPPRASAFSRDRGEGRDGRFLGIPSRDDGILSPASQYSSNDDGGPLGASFGAASQIRSALEALANPASPSTGAVALPNDTQEASLAVGSHTAPEKTMDGVDRPQGRAATDSTNIVNIRMKVDEVLTEVRRLQGHDGVEPGLLHGKLEDMETGIKGDLATLRDLLEGVKAKAGATSGAGTESLAPEIVELHEKLDNLLRLYQARNDQGGGSGSREQEERAPSNELADVIALLKNAEEERATQLEQQTDSIRYLNELNTWLEAFVKHGTSQIEGMAAGVQQLCKDLGPTAELQDGTEEGDAASSGSLLSDIRRFLVQSTEREESTAVLHTSVNGLVAAVQEDLRRNAEARNLLTTESVVGMIDRQRQDQERMLRALATELSNDIRGERLRFVEAMKEATAINVQIHVEEFKKELTREVMLMTQEVTRLQRERQGLEQQIADLFAFYAKQKQAGKVVDGGRMPTQVPPMAQSTLTVIPGAMPMTQSLYRRPLPSPTPSPTRSR